MPTKTDYILIGVGAFLAVIVTSYIPSLMKVLSSENVNVNVKSLSAISTTPPNYHNMSIESVDGIDTGLLKIVNQRFPD